MRSPDELLESGLAVIDRAYVMGGYRCAPLFSGGHDSLCACYVASQHRSFTGSVNHIRTGIGSEYTFGFVQRVCDGLGWKLNVHQSLAKDSYEQAVRIERGMFLRCVCGTRGTRTNQAIRSRRGHGDFTAGSCRGGMRQAVRVGTTTTWTDCGCRDWSAVFGVR